MFRSRLDLIYRTVLKPFELTIACSKDQVLRLNLWNEKIDTPLLESTSEDAYIAAAKAGFVEQG